MTHIGLIGGIGPAATVTYYNRLVAAFRAAHLPLSLTISHAQIDVLAKHAKANDRKGQAAVFAQHLKSLNAAGADIALITALTGHFCFEETKALSPVELLDGIDVIDRFCEAADIKVLGLLGSPPVMSTHLFGKLKRVETVVPQSGVEAIGQTYMTVATSGTCDARQRDAFFRAASEMVDAQGADAILLAGTDLGLAFNGRTYPYRIIDAVALHVDALLKHAGQSSGD